MHVFKRARCSKEWENWPVLANWPGKGMEDGGAELGVRMMAMPFAGIAAY